MTKDLFFDQDSALKQEPTTAIGATTDRNNAILDDDSMTNASASEVSASPTSVAQIAPFAIHPIALTPTRRQPLSGSSWSCPASEKSMRTTNPIRAIVDPIAKNIQSGCQRGDGKDHISLALGDPTVGGNLPACPLAIEKIVENVQSKPHCAGYVNACGTMEARVAIANYHSYNQEHARIGPDNVIIANGCSGALEIALSTLLDPQSILLVPQPGFPLYQVIAESHGASVVYYRLDPKNDWAIDMDHLEEIMEAYSNIRAIVVNNPSNPTGAVFSESCLVDVLDFARKNQLPIVADEVYGELTFGSNQFLPLAQLAARHGQEVPIITASGLAKQFLLPGWRVGWITFHDNIHGSLKAVEEGCKRLAQVVLGASHLAQSAIPALLAQSNPNLALWKENLRMSLEKQAHFLCTKLGNCRGLEVFQPQGAMYSMVKIDTTILDIKNDVEFSMKLLEEQNVFVLPGSAFGTKNIFRVVFCSELMLLGTAAERISDFCNDHTIL